jgi:hypothetical protein
MHLLSTKAVLNSILVERAANMGFLFLSRVGSSFSWLKLVFGQSIRAGACLVKVALASVAVV